MNGFERLALRESSIDVQQNVPLDKYTTLRVGGPADYFAEPASEAELIRLLNAAGEAGMPVLLIGNGSNLLIRDGGFRGLAIRLGKAFSRIEPWDGGLEAQAGALLSALACAAAEASLTGLEFAQGIPGSVGGGVYMNAGAYGGELGNRVESAVVLDRGAVVRIPGEEMGFAYRHSRAMEEGWIVLSARFRLEKGERALIDAAMRDFSARRKEKQPLNYPSAGSFFKRPAGHFAGALIEGAGLKGLSCGGAQVSEKHAGFLVNTGGASASDFLALMGVVQDTVRKAYGVELEPEVRIVGDDP
jgi:UDP-N-acetylmuramate dehydrogenase